LYQKRSPCVPALGLAAVLFLASVTGLSAQAGNRPYWFTLEQGKLYFRNGDYGRALLSFEEARRQREAMYSRMEAALIDLLSLPEVRRMGDSLSRIEAYIAERGYINAANALEELYYRCPRENFEGSVQAALKKIGELKAYPEAEYWLGEVYRAEGELSIALGQYSKAHEDRDLLEIPGFDLEILYRTAELRRLRREFNDMEESYTTILEQDTLWMQDSDSFMRRAMARTLETEGIDRFLAMYRYNNGVVEKAHRMLGFYYYDVGRYNHAAEQLLFSFLIQSTLMAEELSRGNYGYSVSGAADLINAAERRSELASYMADVDFYRTIYYLGSALYGDGKPRPARELWGLLRGRTGAGEWRTRAEAQLASPYVEPMRERRP
jgi:tetratricopeptide (TPR) repeat protein